MEWINSVTFDPADTEMKSKLHDILDYYTYPGTLYDPQKDRVFSTQLSNVSMNTNPQSEIDKEWFCSFKD